jgi:hypothetical protein
MHEEEYKGTSANKCKRNKQRADLFIQREEKRERGFGKSDMYSDIKAQSW